MNFVYNFELIISQLQENFLWLEIISYLVIISFAIGALYYVLFYIPILFKNKRSEESNQEPVSVIICAKNEEENLKQNLPNILNQDYPDFEVIVVNDGSSDNTEELLGEMRSKYSHLKFTSIEEDQKFNHGKKLALTVGIKAAKNEQLILTDADCYPKSKNWIQSIQKNFNGDTEIVLGYGGYAEKKGWINKLIRFDTLFIAMQYFGFAKIGIPYMGVGRNLAYKKSLFFKNKGFASHSYILSGDDDLFINEVANKRNCINEFSIDSHTLSEPKTRWIDWKKQKQRHLSTGKHYKFIHKFLLFLEPFSRILFYTFSIFLLIFGYKIELIGILLVSKITIQLIAIKLIMKRLDEKGFWLLSIIFDILLPFIYFYFLISNYLLRKNNKWN